MAARLKTLRYKVRRVTSDGESPDMSDSVRPASSSRVVSNSSSGTADRFIGARRKEKSIGGGRSLGRLAGGLWAEEEDDTSRRQLWATARGDDAIGQLSEDRRRRMLTLEDVEADGVSGL